MRAILLFLPVILVAQTAPPRSGATPGAPAKSAPGTAAAPKAAPAKTATAGQSALTTDDQKAIYSLGLTVYRSLTQFDLSPAELDIFKRALSDAQAGKPAIDINEWGPKIDPLAKARGARVAEREKAASATYLAQAAAKPGAVKTPSGMVYRELTAGTGASPKPTDKVKVHYRGTLTNGTEFDSSYSRNMPAEFPLNGVIKCWTEGVQHMKVGGKSELVCPSDLAYGDQGRPQIPGGATLVFQVELLDILK
jgi:FKBP-type peptidyl-prolyl cis-trans isomerase FkpA